MNQNVKFETENELNHSFPTTSDKKKIPAMAGWVIKSSGGLIKNEKQASYVLVGFVILAVIIFSATVFDNNIEIPKKALENPEYGLPIID
jgi:hypothetical protein